MRDRRDPPYALEPLGLQHETVPGGKGGGSSESPRLGAGAAAGWGGEGGEQPPHSWSVLKVELRGSACGLNAWHGKEGAEGGSEDSVQAS